MLGEGWMERGEGEGGLDPQGGAGSYGDTLWSYLMHASVDSARPASGKHSSDDDHWHQMKTSVK